MRAARLAAGLLAGAAAADGAGVAGFAGARPAVVAVVDAGLDEPHPAAASAATASSALPARTWSIVAAGYALVARTWYTDVKPLSNPRRAARRYTRQTRMRSAPASACASAARDSRRRVHSRSVRA